MPTLGSPAVIDAPFNVLCSISAPLVTAVMMPSPPIFSRKLYLITTFKLGAQVLIVRSKSPFVSLQGSSALQIKSEDIKIPLRSIFFKILFSIVTPLNHPRGPLSAFPSPSPSLDAIKIPALPSVSLTLFPYTACM